MNMHFLTDNFLWWLSWLPRRTIEIHKSVVLHSPAAFASCERPTTRTLLLSESNLRTPFAPLYWWTIECICNFFWGERSHYFKRSWPINSRGVPVRIIEDTSQHSGLREDKELDTLTCKLRHHDGADTVLQSWSTCVWSHVGSWRRKDTQRATSTMTCSKLLFHPI